MKTQARKVCMIAYTLYRYDSRVRRAAEALATQEKYNVLVIVPKEDSSPKIYELEGVRIRELNMQPYHGKSKLRYMVSYLEFICRTFFICNWLLLRQQIDIFHIHNMPNSLIFAAILARLVRKKLVLDVHDSVPETYAAKFDGTSNKVLFWLLCCEEAVCCWLAHKIICVNHPQRDVLVSRGIDSTKLSVSLNVPDNKWYKVNKGIALHKRDSQKFKLIYHGTLVRRLGIDITIQAVGKLVHRIPDMEFHIYGGGDDREEFVQLTKELKLQEFVHFHGWLPLEEIFPMIKKMDLGIVGNRKSVATELMLPVKMLEYVALNIPVVVPRLKAIQYYFSDEMVSYFEPGDSDSMALSILDLYQSREKRERQAQLARRFLGQFGWEIHQEDFLELYSSL